MNTDIGVEKISEEDVFVLSETNEYALDFDHEGEAIAKHLLICSMLVIIIIYIGFLMISFLLAE